MATALAWISTASTAGGKEENATCTRKYIYGGKVVGQLPQTRPRKTSQKEEARGHQRTLVYDTGEPSFQKISSSSLSALLSPCSSPMLLELNPC